MVLMPESSSPFIRTVAAGLMVGQLKDALLVWTAVTGDGVGEPIRLIPR